VRDHHHPFGGIVTGNVSLTVTQAGEGEEMFGGLAIGFAQISKPSAIARGLPRDARRSPLRALFRRQR